MRKVEFQLYDQGAGVQAGAMISQSGGVVYVAQAGDARKQSIYDSAGAAAANVRALTAGGCEFYVADSVESVDLYIQCPGGQFLVKTGVVPGSHDFAVDTSNRRQVAVIPFAMVDTTVVETDTGFDEVLNALYEPAPAIRVTVIDATETIDVGTATADSGDPDGFLAGISVANAVMVQGLILNGANTMGALFERQDSVNAGDAVPSVHVPAATAKSIVWTPSAGSDTGKGFIYLPYTLCN